MGITAEVNGLNLERLLTLAAEAGLYIQGAERIGPGKVRISLPAREKTEFIELCTRYGWEVHLTRISAVERIIRYIKRRPMLLCGTALYLLMMAISSNMILAVRIDEAGKNLGEIRSYLREEGIGCFSLKAAVSPQKLRDALMLRLPDLAHVSVAYEGSRLVIDCQPSLEGEQAMIGGEGMDLVAAQDGIITGIVVKSGTPAVSIGQAVCKGDVLICGEERGEKGSSIKVEATGEVTARVWSRGDARVSRTKERTVETGAVRRRVTVCTPWHRRLVCDAKPFDKQDISMKIVPVVGLYLPLWREIETLAQIEVITEERKTSDAVSMAQGAAEQAAKNKCPPGVHILDKTVENSMIDNEYVYAAVVLEYETGIAVRAAQNEEMIR